MDSTEFYSTIITTINKPKQQAIYIIIFSVPCPHQNLFVCTEDSEKIANCDERFASWLVNWYFPSHSEYFKQGKGTLKKSDQKDRPFRKF